MSRHTTSQMYQLRTWLAEIEEEQAHATTAHDLAMHASGVLGFPVSTDQAAQARRDVYGTRTRQAGQMADMTGRQMCIEAEAEYPVTPERVDAGALDAWARMNEMRQWQDAAQANMDKMNARLISVENVVSRIVEGVRQALDAGDPSA